MNIPTPKFNIDDEFESQECGIIKIIGIEIFFTAKLVQINYQCLINNKKNCYIYEYKLETDMAQGRTKPYKKPLISWWKLAKPLDRILLTYYKGDFISSASVLTVAGRDDKDAITFVGNGITYKYSEQDLYNMITSRGAICTPDIKALNE